MSAPGRSQALIPEPFRGEGTRVNSSVTLDPLALPLAGRQLIEASAGTGKTWTLAALYLRLVLERGLEPRQILVLTFTNAATAELQQRIRARLAQLQHRLRQGRPGDDSFVEALLAHLAHLGIATTTVQQRLTLALQGFDDAAISTIHGFCQRALAELPFTAGAPLALELLPDERALRLQFVHDHWRVQLGDATSGLPDAAATLLAQLMLAKRDSPERWDHELALVLQQPLARCVWPEGVPRHTPDADSDAELGALVMALHDAYTQARDTWATARQAISDIVDEARERLHKTSYKAAAVDRAFNTWDAWLAAPVGTLPSADEFKRLSLLGSARLKPTGKQAPPHPHPFFTQAQTLLDAVTLAQREDSPLGARRLWLLRDLLERGPARLAAIKRAARVQSFGDMLSQLHQRLTSARGASLAQALRTRWPAALIDESQDTDAQQIAIFNAIYGAEPSSPVLLLGDPKQAIYGFRGADLHSYLQQREQASQRHSLATNQRSTPELLAALNRLFASHPRAFVLDGLAYTPVQAGTKRKPVLQDDAGQLGTAALRLWLLPRRSDGAGYNKAALQRRVAAAMADQIAQLLAQADRIRLDGQPLAGGDIAVLVRSHREGALMRRALAERGVASVELSRQGVHQSSEARELETVLAAFVQPTQPGLLNAALATSLMGHTAQSLAALQADEAALQTLIANFQAQHQRWQQRGVGVMLRRWLTEPDALGDASGGSTSGSSVTARLLAHADGERRLTNVLHLAERLQQQEQASRAGPLALLRWLAEQRQGSADGSHEAEGQLLRLESDRQLVQIVTLHRAKGLEYPFVFAPFMWDMNPAPQRGIGLAYHGPAGEALIDFRELDSKKSPEHALATQQRRAEMMRLLYVGVTRAVHRLWLTVGLCGHGKTGAVTQSARGILNSLVAGGDQAPEAFAQNKLTADAIEAAWDHLAMPQPGDASPLILLEPLPEQAQASRFQAALPAPESLSALPAPRHIAAPWSLASYSSLWLSRAHEKHERAAIDHDHIQVAAAELPADDNAPIAALAEDDFLNFPRGAAAGECLHAVFERIDFADSAHWAAVVSQQLREHRMAGDEGTAQTLQRMVLNMLGAVLNTPLPGAAPLAQVPARRRLVELEFCLHAAREQGVVLQALRRLMRVAGLGDISLAAIRLQGYVRGFIDLVFEHEGRWWIVDWKSNHLGFTAADYAGPALAQAMAAHGYHLQSLLYVLALHRWLGQRLPNYQPERHLGGVHYLFLRGMRAPTVDTWRDASPTSGVHTWRPSAELLAQASALFGEVAAA